ncbi:hypothetical protein [Mesobacillus maritimus]|uniref:Uncharacterized protein n=1 Tax=Mesobacillus maritimus TaxID=1643336 RepID=A0ABS7K9A0_9BACI|nr:hypothetical protein [Mesobacillus maritimus]MBY0098671.1 hypothetical protein [Mesobacillus maritimus]
MREVETIKAKIEELESKKEQLSTELAALSEAIENSFEDLLLGKVDNKTIDQAKAKFEELQAEIVKTDEYIQRAKAVRKKLAREKLIPFAKQKRQKAAAEVQAKYNKQVEVVHGARVAFLEELAKLGRIKNEVGGINTEYSSLVNDIGEEVSYYDKAILDERKVHSPENYTKEIDCIGLKVETQVSVYASGNVPNWGGGASK